MSAHKRTLIRTIRISKALDSLLRKDAKTKRIPVDALVSSIMTKYAEWDRYNERFGVNFDKARCIQIYWIMSVTPVNQIVS